MIDAYRARLTCDKACGAELKLTVTGEGVRDNAIVRDQVVAALRRIAILTDWACVGGKGAAWSVGPHHCPTCKDQPPAETTASTPLEAA